MSTKASKTNSKKPISQAHVARIAIDDIEQLFKKMGLDPKAEKRSKRIMVGTAHVPMAFIEEAAAAADQQPGLLGTAFDAARAREAMAYAIAFEPVATKAEAFAQRVRDAILIARSEAGAASLATYASMKGLVRLPDGAPLRDSFDRMTHLMKRGRRAAATPPVAVPAVAQPAASPVLAIAQPAKAA